MDRTRIRIRLASRTRTGPDGAIATRLAVSPLTTRPRASANFASKVLSLSRGSRRNASKDALGPSTTKIQAVASSGRSEAPATEERSARRQLANWIVVGHAPSFNSVDLTLYGVISAEAPVRRFKTGSSRRRGLSESDSLDESGSGSGPFPAATCGFARGDGRRVGIEISSSPVVREP